MVASIAIFHMLFSLSELVEKSIGNHAEELFCAGCDYVACVSNRLGHLFYEGGPCVFLAILDGVHHDLESGDVCRQVDGERLAFDQAADVSGFDLDASCAHQSAAGAVTWLRVSS